MTRQIGITAVGAVSAVGAGHAAHADAMRTLRTGLRPCTIPGVSFSCYTGEVAALDTLSFPPRLSAYDNRASRLAVAGLDSDGFVERVGQAVARWGPGRVALVIGTSTSGVERLESAYRERSGDAPLAAAYSLRHHNDHHAVTDFTQRLLGIEGPAYTVSTACSSSAKSIVDAWQLIGSGVVDAAVAGGVDSLCLTSLYGFEALELVSREPCRPMDRARTGLSIGEGAGFLLLERDGDGPRLSGYGESSDATNMSTPPPDGAGASQAMRQAVERAGISPAEVSFVKLHGTATLTNDSAELAGVASIVPESIPAASLKGLIGHTLGAAGTLEVAMSLYAMRAGICPGNAGVREVEPAFGTRIAIETKEAAMQHVLCNAFGFGGSNCCLVLSAD